MIISKKKLHEMMKRHIERIYHEIFEEDNRRHMQEKIDALNRRVEKLEYRVSKLEITGEYNNVKIGEKVDTIPCDKSMISKT